MSAVMEWMGLILTWAALLVGLVALLFAACWATLRLLDLLLPRLKMVALFWRFVWWVRKKGEHPDLVEHIKAREQAERAVEQAAGLVRAAHAALSGAGLLRSDITFEHDGMQCVWTRGAFARWLGEHGSKEERDIAVEIARAAMEARRDGRQEAKELVADALAIVAENEPDHQQRRVIRRTEQIVRDLEVSN